MADVNKKTIPPPPPPPSSMMPLSIDMDELSMTLIERRKRLHELANEINQWEDESTKAIALATSSLANALSAASPAAANTPTQNHHPSHTAVSPSPRLGGLRQTSPSPHHYHITNMTHNNSICNKENRTPTNSCNLNTTGGKPITPVSNEILSVAKRILAKKQPNSESSSASAPTVVTTVKSIASKFENMTNGGGENKDESIVLEKLTPRSIIQKFEKMANNGGRSGSAVVTANRKPITDHGHKVGLLFKISLNILILKK